MKRNALIKHLLQNNYELAREGKRHSIWKNNNTGDLTAIPRHNEIK